MKIFKKWMGLLLVAMMICVLSACGSESERAAPTTRMAPSAAGNDYMAKDEYDDEELYDETDEETYEDDELYDETYEDEEESVEYDIETFSANFDEAYYGTYSDTQVILLGFNPVDGCGLAAIMSDDLQTLDWVCVGDWTQDGASHTFDDGKNPNVVQFTVESSTDNGIRINWMGDGFLDLEDADPQTVVEFFAMVDNGEFQYDTK